MDSETTGVLVRAFLDDGAVRLILVEATGPAERTRVVHGLGPDAARIGSESLVAAALNAAYVKGDEQLAFQVAGEQPRCEVYADVTADGAVRARVTPPDLVLEDGRLNGVLVAIKSLGSRELYRGHTEMVHTTVEQALATHLGSSIQVDDVLRIGVKLGPDGTVVQAGGLLLERMPEERERVSLTHQEFEARYSWVRDADMMQVLTQLAFGSLGDRPLHVLEQRPLVWKCRCSKHKTLVALAAVGRDTLQAMIDEDHGAEVTCHFCNTTYVITEDELLERLGQLPGM